MSLKRIFIYIYKLILLFYDNFFSFFKETTHYCMTITYKLYSYDECSYSYINDSNTLIDITSSDYLEQFYNKQYNCIKTTIKSDYADLFNSQETKGYHLEKSSFNNARAVYLYVINVNDSISFKFENNNDRNINFYYQCFLNVRISAWHTMYIEINRNMVNDQFNNYYSIYGIVQGCILVAIF